MQFLLISVLRIASGKDVCAAGCHVPLGNLLASFILGQASIGLCRSSDLCAGSHALLSSNKKILCAQQVRDPHHQQQTPVYPRDGTANSPA